MCRKLKQICRLLTLIVVGLANHLPVTFGQTAGEALKSLNELPNPERRLRLVEGAKKESRLVFYGTLGVDASSPFLDLFRKSHPYISIDHYRTNEGGIYNRVLTEGKAGKHSVDVIESASLTANSLIDRGLVDAYHSPESVAIRKEFVDPNRLWHGYSYLPVALGYNRNHVKDNERPKSYDDLLLPLWKGGRLSLDTEDADIFRTFVDTWGEARAVEYFRRLAKQEIQFRNGHTLQAQLVAAGEIAVAPWLYSHRLMMLAEKGAPVGLVFLDPVVSVPKILMLAKRAPHPNAAALFIDWALSSEGQNFVGMVIARSPARTNQPQKFMKLGEPKTVPMRPELFGSSFDRYNKLYREIFGLR